MVKVFNDVVSVKFDAKFIGDGIINADSKEQRYALIEYGLLNPIRTENKKLVENYKFAKRVIEKNAEGKWVYRIKISPDCIKYHMFPQLGKLAGFAKSPEFMATVLCDPRFILRGYVYTFKDLSNYKRKSPLMMMPAVSDEFDKKIRVEVCTNSNPVEVDTSLRYEECVGKLDYTLHGAIDLTELQFISADPRFGRQAIPYDGGGECDQIYINTLDRNFKTAHKYGHYKIKNALMEDFTVEDGILLNYSDVDYMIKYFFRRMFGLEIMKAKASLNQVGSIKLIVMMYGGVSESIELKSVSDLDNYVFNYHQKYTEELDEAKVNTLGKEFDKLKKDVNTRRDNKVNNNKNSRTKNETLYQN